MKITLQCDMPFFKSRIATKKSNYYFSMSVTITAF